MRNQGYFLTEVGKLELRDLPMPACGDDDVVIKIEYMGICGSDLFFFGDHNHEIQDGLYELPFQLGHECAGEVVETGKNVSGLKVGDKVAVEPGVPCGNCDFCRSGRYNLCPDVNFMAAPPFASAAMNRYIAHPAKMTFKLPENVSTKEGALVEPLAIGLHSTGRAGIGLGDTVAIIGTGCIGLTILMACKARGAANVIMIDVFDKRLEKAKELGADYVINSRREDPMKRMAEILDGDMPQFVCEAAGRPETVVLATELLRRGGTHLQVGSVNAMTSLQFNKLTEKEANIIFSFRYANMYPTAIKAVSSGKIDIGKLATDEFSFKDAQFAFEQAEKNKQEVVKAVIKF